MSVSRNSCHVVLGYVEVHAVHHWAQIVVGSRKDSFRDSLIKCLNREHDVVGVIVERRQSRILSAVLSHKVV